jgi:hypothetical protein
MNWGCQVAYYINICSVLCCVQLLELLCMALCFILSCGKHFRKSWGQVLLLLKLPQR